MALSIKENNYAVITGQQKDGQGRVQNITGWSFEFQVRRKDGSIFFSKVSSDSSQIAIIDVLTGKTEIYIQAVDTHFFPGDYSFELKGTDQFGHPFTLVGPDVLTITKTNI